MPTLSSIIAPGNVATRDNTLDLTNKTIDFANNDLTGVASTDTVQTLANKTIDSPILTGTTTSSSGNVVFDPSSQILEIRGDGTSVVGQIQLNCHVNTHGQIIASQPHSESATNVLTLPGGNTIGNADAVLVSDTGTQTLTNKTLGNVNENITTDTSTSGTLTFNTSDQGIVYLTANQSADRTLNIVGNGTTTLDEYLPTGQSVTFAILSTQGSTPYYFNEVQIDGTTVTPQWQGGSAPSAGNADSIDSYSFTIIKTAASTFTVLASQTQFA